LHIGAVKEEDNVYSAEPMNAGEDVFLIFLSSTYDVSYPFLGVLRYIMA
jgi:hypothetical protein